MGIISTFNLSHILYINCIIQATDKKTFQNARQQRSKYVHGVLMNQISELELSPH